MAGAGGGNIGSGFGGSGGMSGRGNGDAVFSGLEQGGLGVPVDLGNGMIGFANPLTGEVTVPGEAFGLPAGSTVTVSPSDPNSAVADVATPAGTMTMGLDKALGLFGGGDQGFGSIMSGGSQPNLGDFGSQLEREAGAVLAPNPDPGTGYDFGLAGPATGQFGGPGFSIGSFGPGDVAIAMDEAGLDPGFNGIEGTQTKGEIAADFANSVRGGSRLGGPSDEEGDPATNAFDASSAFDSGINGAVGFGPGASDHEMGVNAAMDAARGNSQINAGDLGLQVDPGNDSGAYGRNIGAIDQALGEIAVAAGTNQVASDLGTSMADIAAGGRGQTGNAFDSDIADISASQAAREGTIADLNAAADAALGRNGSDEGGINTVGDSAAIDGAIGGENAVGPGLAGSDFGSGFGNLSGGSETAAFGADGLSDGPGLGSFGGGDVGVDIAAGKEGIDMGSRVGDFANSNIAPGTTTGENAFDTTTAAATGPSVGEGFDSSDSAEIGASGGFDGTGMGGMTGGGTDITGGVADMGMGGLGDGGGREAGIGGGFAGLGDIGSGNAFDGGSQVANDSSSSVSDSSGVASGGSSGRGGRGQGGDDISGGWGWDGGGWDGSADGISGGFGREGGGEGRAAADGTGGGFGWG